MWFLPRETSSTKTHACNLVIFDSKFTRKESGEGAGYSGKSVKKQQFDDDIASLPCLDVSLAARRGG
jgi:hypothetical protein